MLRPQLLDSIILDEAQRHLQALLRLDSRNPGAFETEVADYLVAVLRADGLACTVVEPHPRRRNIFTALEVPTGEPGLLLSAHLDTVPFDERAWSVPPLSGDLRDGCIYGRGSVDMKHHLVYCLMTILLLHRKGIPLCRTVRFAGFADEEAGCAMGSRFIVDHHPELLSAGYALNEVGGFPIYFKGRKYFLLGTEEKGFAWVRLVLRGTPGHGSIPTRDNVILRISEIVGRLNAADRRVRLSNAACAFVDTLARGQNPLTALALRLLQKPILTDRLIALLLPSDRRATFTAMFHNTYNPTVVLTDESVNVVPSSLILCLDCRIVPGGSVAEVLELCRATFDDEAEVSLIQGSEPVQQSKDQTLVEHVTAMLEREAPDSTVAPYLTLGFTDSTNLNRLGIAPLGFSPLDLPPELNFTALFHGHDERIPLAGFRWGMDFFYRVVHDFVAARPGAVS